MIKSVTRYNFPVKHGNWKTWHWKMGGFKRQKCNDRHFVIIRLFRNMITFTAYLSKSFNLSECCLHSFEHSKRYNRAKTKTCHLPGYGPLKVWSTVKIRGTRVPQKAIVPVGRPRPYSIIILNMRFIPKATLRASSQITASSYILERHLWVNNTKPLALTPTWSLYYCGDVETAWPQACMIFFQTLYIYSMLGQCWASIADVGLALKQHWINVSFK